MSKHKFEINGDKLILCNIEKSCTICEKFLWFRQYSFFPNSKISKISKDWINFNIEYEFERQYQLDSEQFFFELQILFEKLYLRDILSFKKSDLFMFITFNGLNWSTGRYKITVHFFSSSDLKYDFHSRIRRVVRLNNTKFKVSHEFNRWIDEDFLSLSRRLRQMSVHTIQNIRNSKMSNETKKWLMNVTHYPMERVYVQLNRQVKTRFTTELFGFK